MSMKSTHKLFAATGTAVVLLSAIAAVWPAGAQQQPNFPERQIGQGNLKRNKGPIPPVQRKVLNNNNGKFDKDEQSKHIYDAEAALQQAVNALKQGDHDYGGHRQKALNDAVAALANCRRAIQYHETHDKPPVKP